MRVADSLQGADALCLWRIATCYFFIGKHNITLCALKTIGSPFIFCVFFQSLEKQ